MLRAALSRMFRGSPTREQSAQTPFPKQQFFVLALCRIAEPIALMSIFPYIYFMIASFNITDDDRKIAMYAGLVTSVFTLAEFSTGMLWGRISDRIGRKPVLMTGLVGTGLSMVIFGLAPNLQTALIARALGGLLNGNMGVLQTVVAEIVTVKEHQPRAYSIMPSIWCLGSIIGPAMAGALAEPVKNYPRFFAQGTIFDRYPFLLPNLVCASVVVLGVIVGILFLEETHSEKKFRRDPGLEFGKYLVSTADGLMKKLFAGKRGQQYSPAMLEDPTLEPPFFEDDDTPPVYRTTDGSPRLPTLKNRRNEPQIERLTLNKSRGVLKVFNRQVIMAVVSFGILAYHSIAFDQLMPVFLSTPVSEEQPSLPFKFTGGFALPTKTIGVMMAVQGVYSLMAQLCLFPFLVRRFGTIRTFRGVITMWPLLYLATPYLILLPKPLQTPAAYMTLILKITMQVVAFPSIAIILRNNVPSLLVLGSVNGFAASVASLSRSLGPTVTGIVHSAGLSIGCSGLAWWAMGLVSIVGAIESCWLEEPEDNIDRPVANDEEDPLCETFVETKDAVGGRQSFDSVDKFDLAESRP